MADNRRWFKIWTTILNDPHLYIMPLEDIARWFLLGALVAEHGNNGVLKVSKKQLSNLFRNDENSMKISLHNMPNISYENCNDTITVTFDKWSKYQVDTTSSARVKKWRNEHLCNGDKKRREEKRNIYRKSVFLPPSIEEVKAYCEERNKGVIPEKWLNHYTSNGWMVGKNKMKDWKAAVRTWEKESLPDWRG